MTGKLFTGPGTCGMTDVRGRGCGMDVDEDVDIGVDVDVGLGLTWRRFVLRLFGLACSCWRGRLPPVSRFRSACHCALCLCTCRREVRSTEHGYTDA